MIYNPIYASFKLFKFLPTIDSIEFCRVTARGPIISVDVMLPFLILLCYSSFFCVFSEVKYFG